MLDSDTSVLICVSSRTQGDAALCKGHISPTLFVCVCVCQRENDGKYFSTISALFDHTASPSYQENLARLQRAFARKWEFIYMQAEAQVK